MTPAAPAPGIGGDGSPAAPAAAPQHILVRPHRIVGYGAVAASFVLAASIVVGVLLRGSSDGVTFRVADQVGVIGVGLLLAGGIMLVARPRLRADATGMSVRNILGESFYPWPVVVRIAFPEGAHWAQVMLADDEAYPLMAIQAMDRQRAVDALRAVRAMQAAYAPAAPTRSPEAADRARRRAQAEAAAAAARPLGRLEIIDRQKAAMPPRRGRRRRGPA